MNVSSARKLTLWRLGVNWAVLPCPIGMVIGVVSSNQGSMFLHLLFEVPPWKPSILLQESYVYFCLEYVILMLLWMEQFLPSDFLITLLLVRYRKRVVAACCQIAILLNVYLGSNWSSISSVNNNDFFFKISFPIQYSLCVSVYDFIMWSLAPGIVRFHDGWAFAFGVIEMALFCFFFPFPLCVCYLSAGSFQHIPCIMLRVCFVSYFSTKIFKQSEDTFSLLPMYFEFSTFSFNHIFLLK